MKRIAIFGLLVLAGCTPVPPAPEPPVPLQRSVQPAAPTVPATPTIAGQEFRLRAEFLGKVDVTFSVQLNGVDVGTFNADASNDVTALVHPGGNTVHVTWLLDKRMPKDDRAQLYIESKRSDQENWSAVFSREVNALTQSQESSGTFAVPITLKK